MNSIVNKIYADTLSDKLQGTINSDGGLFSQFSVEDGNALGNITSSILAIALPLAGTVTLVLLIVAGYKMMSSQGNPDKLKDAREIITNAIIGLVFILLSIAILLLISNVFNLDAINA
jgi:hypothetical protein